MAEAGAAGADAGAAAGAAFVDLGGVRVHVPKPTTSEQLIATCRNGGDDACQKLVKATNRNVLSYVDVARKDAEIQELQSAIQNATPTRGVAKKPARRRRRNLTPLSSSNAGLFRVERFPAQSLSSSEDESTPLFLDDATPDDESTSVPTGFSGMTDSETDDEAIDDETDTENPAPPAEFNVVEVAEQGAFYEQSARECSAASFYNMHILNRLRLQKEPKEVESEDLQEFCGGGVDYDDTNTKNLVDMFNMGAFFLTMQDDTYGLRTYVNKSYLTGQDAFNELCTMVFSNLLTLEGTGLILENTENPNSDGFGNHYTAMVRVDDTFYEIDSNFPTKPAIYNRDEARERLWGLCKTRMEAGAKARFVVTVDNLDTNRTDRVAKTIANYINDASTPVFALVRVVLPEFGQTDYLELTAMGQSLQASCTYNYFDCRSQTAFETSFLGDAKERKINGVLIVVATADEDAVAALPGNRCCAIVETVHKDDAASEARFVENPPSETAIQPKVIVEANTDVLESTLTAYTSLLPDGGSADVMGISDTIVFKGTKYTASCVRDIVTKYIVRVERIVVVFESAQDALFGEAVRVLINDFSGAAAGAADASSPFPEPVVLDPNEDLSDFADSSNEVPLEALDASLLFDSNVDDDDSNLDTDVEEVGVDSAEERDTPEACRRDTLLKTIAEVKIDPTRGRGWFAKDAIKLDQYRDNVLAPYEGVRGTINGIPFQAHYKPTHDDRTPFDTFLAKLTPANKKKFEAYSMETNDGGILSAYHPDSSKIPAGALINHDGFNPNVKFMAANNGCVDITLITNVAAGEELLADYGGTYDFTEFPKENIGFIFVAEQDGDLDKLVEWSSWMFSLFGNDETSNQVGAALTESEMQTQAGVLRDTFQLNLKMLKDPKGNLIELTDSDVIIAYQMQPTFMVCYFSLKKVSISGDVTKPALRRVGCGAHTGYDKDKAEASYTLRVGTTVRRKFNDSGVSGFDYYNLLTGDKRGSRTSTAALAPETDITVFALPTFGEVVAALSECKWDFTKKTGPNNIPWEHYDRAVFLNPPFTSKKFGEFELEERQDVAQNAFGSVLTLEVMTKISAADYREFVKSLSDAIQARLDLLRAEIQAIQGRGDLSDDEKTTAIAELNHHMAMAVAQHLVGADASQWCHTGLKWRGQPEDYDDEKHPEEGYRYNLFAMYQAGYPPFIESETVRYYELARIMRHCPTVKDVHKQLCQFMGSSTDDFSFIAVDDILTEYRKSHTVNLDEWTRVVILKLCEAKGPRALLYSYFVQTSTSFVLKFPLRASGVTYIDKAFRDADHAYTVRGYLEYLFSEQTDTEPADIDLESNDDTDSEEEDSDTNIESGDENDSDEENLDTDAFTRADAEALPPDAVNALLVYHYSFAARMADTYELMRIEAATNTVVLPPRQSKETTRGVFGFLQDAQSTYRTYFEPPGLSHIVNPDQPTVEIPTTYKDGSAFKAENIEQPRTTVSVRAPDFDSFQAMMYSDALKSEIFPSSRDDSENVYDALAKLEKTRQNIASVVKRLKESTKLRDNVNAVAHLGTVLPALIGSSIEYYESLFLMLDPHQKLLIDTVWDEVVPKLRHEPPFTKQDDTLLQGAINKMRDKGTQRTLKQRFNEVKKREYVKLTGGNTDYDKTISYDDLWRIWTNDDVSTGEKDWLNVALYEQLESIKWGRKIQTPKEFEAYIKSSDDDRPEMQQALQDFYAVKKRDINSSLFSAVASSRSASGARDKTKRLTIGTIKSPLKWSSVMKVELGGVDRPPPSTKELSRNFIYFNPWAKSQDVDTKGKLIPAFDELALVAGLVRDKVTQFLEWEPTALRVPKQVQIRRTYDLMKYGTEQFFQQAFTTYGIDYVANKTVTVTLARIFYEEAEPGQQNPFMLALDVALRADGRTKLKGLTPETRNSRDDPRVTSAVLGVFKSKPAEVRVPLMEGDKQVDLHFTGDDTDSALCKHFLQAAHPQIRWSDEHVAYARYALYARLVYYCFVKAGMVETSEGVVDAVKSYGKLKGNSTTLEETIKTMVGFLVKAMEALRDVISLNEYITAKSDAAYTELCSERVGDVIARLLLRHAGPTVVRRVLFAVVKNGKYTMSTRMNKKIAYKDISERVSVLFNNPEFDPTNIASYVRVLNNPVALNNREHIQRVNTAFLTEALSSSSTRKQELIKAILTHPYANPGSSSFEDACSQSPKDFFIADVFEKAQTVLGCNVDEGGVALLEDPSPDDSESKPESNEGILVDQGADGGAKSGPSQKTPTDSESQKRRKTLLDEAVNITRALIVSAIQDTTELNASGVLNTIKAKAKDEDQQVLVDTDATILLQKALFSNNSPTSVEASVIAALGILRDMPLTPKLADFLYELLPTPRGQNKEALVASTVFLKRALSDYNTQSDVDVLKSVYEHEYRRSVKKSVSFKDMCAANVQPNGVFKEVELIVCPVGAQQSAQRADEESQGSGVMSQANRDRITLLKPAPNITRTEVQGERIEDEEERRRKIRARALEVGRDLHQSDTNLTEALKLFLENNEFGPFVQTFKTEYMKRMAIQTEIADDQICGLVMGTIDQGFAMLREAKVIICLEQVRRKRNPDDRMTPKVADDLFNILLDPEAFDILTASTFFLRRAWRDYGSFKDNDALYKVYEHECKRVIGRDDDSIDVCDLSMGSPLFENVKTIVCSRKRKRTVFNLMLPKGVVIEFGTTDLTRAFKTALKKGSPNPDPKMVTPLSQEVLKSLMTIFRINPQDERWKAIFENDIEFYVDQLKTLIEREHKLVYVDRGVVKTSRISWSFDDTANVTIDGVEKGKLIPKDFYGLLWYDSSLSKESTADKADSGGGKKPRK